MKPSGPIFRLKRQAKLLARESGVPLHTALDQVARNEGFRAWSHLAASASDQRPASGMLARLAPGDLLLLGARPGQGKTLMGLALAVEAARIGRPAFFFTLEDDEGALFDRLRLLGVDRKLAEDKIALDTSDDICAEYMMNRVGDDVENAVIIIDYLQLLDQRRRNPELDVQIRALRAFAGATGSIIVALSQIDRAFEATGRSFPKLADIRLPNPFDLSLFTKACFMHDGEAHLQELA